MVLIAWSCNFFGQVLWRCNLVQNKFLEAHVILDNRIMRYIHNSNGTNNVRHALFMKEIFKTIIRVYGTPMPMGQTIYEDLSTFITNLGVKESQFPCIHKCYL